MPKLHQNGEREGGVTNPRRRRSIANCSGPQAREAVAPTQRLAPALALGLLAEDRLPWTRPEPWLVAAPFPFVDDRLWEGACRYEPMLVVDSRGRASQKRGCVVDSIWREQPCGRHEICIATLFACFAWLTFTSTELEPQLEAGPARMLCRQGKTLSLHRSWMRLFA